VACDVPSVLYSYSFAPNPEWSHRFAAGAEILDYLKGVASTNGVVESIRFGEEVVRCDFVDGRWHLETSLGAHEVADVVIAATGVLHHPALPDIEGIGSFGGRTVHTARWDPTVPIDGQRIGIIGTGSSAIQMVAAIADRVQALSLFQRTAQWVMPQENPAYTEGERRVFREDPTVMTSLHEEISEMFANGFSNAVVDAESEGMRMIEAACVANLEGSVADVELRERLRPDYRAACKRLVVSPDFYSAIQHPNADLVTDAIQGVEPDGVRTVDGRLHELDVLVLATGFRVDRFMRPMDVVGPDDTRLADLWAKRPTAYMSIAVPGIPNFFMLNGPNGPIGNFSLIEVAELQFAFILQLVARIRSGECSLVSATARATEAFEATRVEAAKKTVWATGCRSWYLDDRGVPAAWPWTFQRFREVMSEPDMDDFHLTG
jgi:cation diffusion facilitator CzcD-associated flavoprotein CzcO